MRKCTIKSSLKIRSKASLKRAANMKADIAVLEQLCCNDKTDIPRSLLFLDRGGLIFPAKSLLPYYSLVIKSTLNHRMFEELGSDVFNYMHCTCTYTLVFVNVFQKARKDI